MPYLSFRLVWNTLLRLRHSEWQEIPLLSFLRPGCQEIPFSLFHIKTAKKYPSVSPSFTLSRNTLLSRPHSDCQEIPFSLSLRLQRNTLLSLSLPSPPSVVILMRLQIWMLRNFLWLRLNQDCPRWMWILEYALSSIINSHRSTYGYSFSILTSCPKLRILNFSGPECRLQYEYVLNHIHMYRPGARQKKYGYVGTHDIR